MPDTKECVVSCVAGFTHNTAHYTQGIAVKNILTNMKPVQNHSTLTAFEK